jgi:murein L,D-transpeptidase YafK
MGQTRRAATWFLLATIVVCASVFLLVPDRLEIVTDWFWAKYRGEYTLAERLAKISPEAKVRLEAHHKTAGANWPPAEAAFLAFKDQNIIELHTKAPGKTWQLVRRYPILRASGTLGPKLREGDLQVPEGIYRVTFLNPNSRYHVSLRLDYPNAFDREMASLDGRSTLGGDIMIHGKSVSVGCLAMGDEAAEELFVLASVVGLEKLKVIIAPTDFRKNSTSSAPAGGPNWLPQLYSEIDRKLMEFGNGS